MEADEHIWGQRIYGKPLYILFCFVVNLEMVI